MRTVDLPLREVPAEAVRYGGSGIGSSSSTLKRSPRQVPRHQGSEPHPNDRWRYPKNH
jgi:hypothetical protein